MSLVGVVEDLSLLTAPLPATYASRVPWLQHHRLHAGDAGEAVRLASGCRRLSLQAVKRVAVDRLGRCVPWTSLPPGELLHQGMQDEGSSRTP